MEQLWSPWRSKYIDKFKHNEDGEECFLCAAAKNFNNDLDSMIVFRKKHCFVIMNKFPYNNGHLLIAPNNHSGDFTSFDNEILEEMIITAKNSIEVLNEIYHPHGFNSGMNIGRSAGAGVPEHLHFHVIPRWNGDTSFTATISDIKIISYSLEESFLAIRNKFINKFGQY
jgi:ATP adenylyltransferase